MTVVSPEPVFLDTNLLVYASWDAAPLHAEALAVLAAYESAGIPLVISNQVIREYLATMIRPSVPFTVAQIASEIQQFRARFTILEDTPAVLEQLLELLTTGASTKVFDTNIVATMLVSGVRQLHTNNPRDFAPFADHITVIPLVPPPL